MKKLFIGLAVVFLAVFSLGAVLRLVSVTVSHSPTSGDKTLGLVKITEPENLSLGYKVGAMIFRPLIEARIDALIKERGLEQYLDSLQAKIPVANNFSLTEIEPGEGTGARCGQEVSAVILSMEYSDEKEKDRNALNILRDIKNSKVLDPVSFKLGSHEIADLNYALVGMKPGSSGLVIVKSGKGMGSHFVKLMHTSPADTDAAADKIMVFNTADPTRHRGAVSIARCGDKVSILYSIMDATGATVVEEKSAEFTIGARTVPIALELSAENLRSDQLRSVIVPPSLLSGFDEELDRDSIKIINLRISEGWSNKEQE